jgi:hypothetical protein
MRVAELAKFMIARDTARQNKEAGQPKPWTKDKIFQTYRFCNVHREDDAVTRWLRRITSASSRTIRTRGSPRSWPGCSTCPSRWTRSPFSGTTSCRSSPRSCARCSTSARLRARRTSTRLTSSALTASRWTRWITSSSPRPRPAMGDRKKLRPRSGTLQSEYHKRLMEYDGLGSFIAAQVIADLKYMPPFFDENIGIPTAFADDWYSFAASGPGSRRGLNRDGTASRLSSERDIVAHGVGELAHGRCRTSCRSTSARASMRRTCRTASASLTSTSASAPAKVGRSNFILGGHKCSAN